MHTQFEVSSFSHFGDTTVITDKITESQTDRQTDGTTDITPGFNIASFAFIDGEA